MNAKTIILSLSLGTALAAAPVQAGDRDLASRAAESVGRYIAAQGNAALVQVREDMKQSLVDALKPVLPEPQQRATATRQQPSQH